MGWCTDPAARFLRGGLLKMTWKALFCAAGLVLTLPAMAVADSARFDIAAQPLPAALKTFAAQAHMQLLYQYGAVASARGNAVTGDLEKHAALEQLLKNSGLEVIYSSESVATIRPIHATAVANVKGDDPDGSEPPAQPTGDSLQLAQATPGQTPSPSTVEKPAQRASEPQLQEVIVTGSRIPTPVGQQVMPVQTYTREDMQQSGQTTVADFLNTLPDVSTSSFGAETGFTTGIAGQTTVQLHGLPVGTTLVLLDGQRVQTSWFGFFDLSNIPASAVERVEVLPAGASAIYGADALGGAVNIILRKKLDGFEIDGTYGHEIGASDTSSNLAWGRSWDKGSVEFIATFQDRGELLGAQRQLTSTIDFPANYPSFLYVSGDCSPGDVYSLNGQNLPGLSSTEAGVPAGGISGIPTIQEFAATAGKLNQCNNLRYRAIIPHTQQESALLSADYQLTDSVDLFTENLLSYTPIVNGALGPLVDLGQFGGMATLGANNPYNPFHEPVGVSYAYPGILIGQSGFSKTAIRPLLGLRGSLFSDWHYEVTTYLSSDRFKGDFSYGGSVNSAALQAALNSSDPSTALDPFAAGAPGSPGLLQSLVAPPNNQYDVDNQLVDAQSVLRGPLFQTPAGPVEAVVGAEYSREKQHTDFGDGFTPTLDLERRTYALFTEARVPLLADAEQPQKGDRLALSLAGRYDHSDDFGGKATWQSGLIWRPTQTLSLSGSYGLTYKAPELQQISGGQTINTNANTGAVDPFRGGQPVPLVTVISGPNPSLKPETGNSRTLSVTYSSQALQGLAASLTYYAINISDYIGTYNFQELVSNPNLFPGAIIRGPASPQDQQEGFLGPITQINSIDYNYGDLRIGGVDGDVRYAIDTRLGQVTPSVAIAYIFKWQSALTPDSLPVDYVSQNGTTPGWAPRWKGTAALAWRRGPLSMNVAGRYVGRYLDNQTVVPNTNELGNSWFIDWNARFEVGSALAATNPLLSGTYVSLGAVNLFNKLPPLSYIYPTYDPSEYDIRGRFIYMRVGLKW
jgi:iron complex outermembrane receptor protein